MRGFENIVHPSEDTEQLLRGLDEEAFKLAQNPQYQQRLQAFLAEYAHAVPEQEELRGTEPFYTALSPTGALVQIRRRKHRQGEILAPEQRYAAVTGAVWSSETQVWPAVTAYHDKRDGRIVGSHYHLGYVEEGQGLIDLSLSPVEKARQLAQRRVDTNERRNRYPAVHYAHSAYSVRWADGYTESLQGAQETADRMTIAVERGLGTSALSECVPGEQEGLNIA